MASIPSIAPSRAAENRRQDASAPPPRPRNRRWAPFAVAAAFFALGGYFESMSQPVGIANGYIVDASKSGEREAVLQAAGEFRTVAANLLWAKMLDHYHHEYIARGGEWDKNKSILPILNTIIELDPHFTQAYMLMGGTILPKLGRFDEGRDVLAKGIKANPNDWELNREMAMLYAWHEKRPADALPYAEAGLSLANDSFSRNLMSKLCKTLQRQIAESQASTAPRG